MRTIKGNQSFKVGIYLRLSRDDKDKDIESNSITNQRSYILQYLKEKGYSFSGEYVDDGFSGSTFERPSFKQMLQDIENKKINMVVTKDLSRFARSSMTSYYLDEYFPLHNIRYIAILDGYDSYIEDTAKEMAWVKNGINETYCLETSKKVRNGLYQAKKRGLFTGWKAPYGYMRDKSNYHKLIVDKEVSPIVKRIFRLAYNGKSCHQIADILSQEKIPTPSCYAHINRGKKFSTCDIWSPRTISEILTNQTYIGNLTQGRRKKVAYKVKKQIRTEPKDWIIVENTHEAIIDKKIFTLVQNILSKTKNKNIKSTTKLLKGFLYCKECGHALSISQSKDKKRFYCGCSYYQKYSKYKLCTPHTLNYQKLEDLIIQEIRNLFLGELDKKRLELSIKQLEKNNEKFTSTKQELKNLKLKLSNTLKAQDQVYIDKVKGFIEKEQYDRIKEKLQKEVIIQKQEIIDLEQEISHLESLNQEKNPNYTSIIDVYLFQRPLDKRLLANLVDKIYLSEDKKIEIYYKFKLKQQT